MSLTRWLCNKSALARLQKAYAEWEFRPDGMDWVTWVSDIERCRCCTGCSRLFCNRERIEGY